LQQANKELRTIVFYSTNQKFCKEDEMKCIQKEYETKHCCLLERIESIQNQMQSSSLRPIGRKGKHIVDNGLTYKPKRADKKGDNTDFTDE